MMEAFVADTRDRVKVEAFGSRLSQGGRGFRFFRGKNWKAEGEQKNNAGDFHGGHGSNGSK
jgi:hypothetical protein